jgi:1-deoxy-D-xylulose-5-phosphate reductoisomerase
MEPERYPCFNLALTAARKEGTFPTVLSAADEVAVGAFLQGKIGFTEIYRVVDTVLSEHQLQPGRGAEELMEADRWATERAGEIIRR